MTCCNKHPGQFIKHVEVCKKQYMSMQLIYIYFHASTCFLISNSSFRIFLSAWRHEVMNSCISNSDMDTQWRKPYHDYTSIFFFFNTLPQCLINGFMECFLLWLKTVTPFWRSAWRAHSPGLAFFVPLTNTLSHTDAFFIHEPCLTSYEVCISCVCGCVIWNQKSTQL